MKFDFCPWIKIEFLFISIDSTIQIKENLSKRTLLLYSVFHKK